MKMGGRTAGAWVAAGILGGVLAAPAAHGAAVTVSPVQQLDRTGKNGVMGQKDLTQGGAALDWLKPVGTNLSAVGKSGASLLTMTAIGAGTIGTYLDDGFDFTWTGGDAASPTSPSHQGSNFGSTPATNGFRVTFTAPAAGDYVVTYYAAASMTASPQWKLTGTIGAATDFKNALANQGSVDTVDEMIWTTAVTADSAGQVLTLDLTNGTAAGAGALAVTGVSVVAAPEPGTIAALAVGGLLALRGRRRRA